MTDGGELNYNVITDTIEKITENAVRNTNLKIHPKGTFLMAITGLEAEGTRGSCGIVGAKATTNQSCMALFPTKELLTEYLFQYYINYGNSLALEYCQGTKQQSYTAKIVKILPIIVPPTIEEQQAIASTLSDVDALITALEQLITKKRNIKQGAMQQLLTGEKRLPGFGGEWEEKRLGDFASLNRLNIIPASFPDQLFVHFSLPAFDAGKIPVVELGGAIGSNKFRVPQEAILVSKLNPRIQRVWAPTKIPTEAIASTEFLVLTPKEVVSRHYLSVVCSSPSFCVQMELAATGTTGSHQRISPTEALNIKVSLPVEVEEQNAITQILFDMDTEMEALKQKRDKYKAIKQGMMQELLTGKTRLVWQKTRMSNGKRTGGMNISNGMIFPGFYWSLM